MKLTRQQATTVLRHITTDRLIPTSLVGSVTNPHHSMVNLDVANKNGTYRLTFKSNPLKLLHLMTPSGSTYNQDVPNPVTELTATEEAKLMSILTKEVKEDKFTVKETAFGWAIIREAMPYVIVRALSDAAGNMGPLYHETQKDALSAAERLNKHHSENLAKRSKRQKKQSH